MIVRCNTEEFAIVPLNQFEQILVDDDEEMRYSEVEFRVLECQLKLDLKFKKNVEMLVWRCTKKFGSPRDLEIDTTGALIQGMQDSTIWHLLQEDATLGSRFIFFF